MTLTTVATVGDDEERTADATVRAPAADLILAMYSRIPLHRLHVDGDRLLVERLLAWASNSTD